MRCRILGLLVPLACGLLAGPLTAAAPPPAQLPRIALLGLSPPPAASEPVSFLEAFRHELREHGWVEGHTMAIEYRWVEGGLEQFATLVAELARLPVDVLVVPNARTARIAQQATTTIPIVVVRGSYLMEQGLVDSLARPGGNVTGVSTLGPGLSTKRLELLKEAMPRATRVAVLRGRAAFRPELSAMEVAARPLGVQLQPLEVREPDEFASACAAMTTAQAEALVVLGDPFFVRYRDRAQIAALAAQHRLPAICSSHQYVEAGCLMSYGANPHDRGQRIAAYVDKLLKGATPADLPVEQIMRFELVINLKTAQALGLTMPPSLLFQADEVIREVHQEGESAPGTPPSSPKLTMSQDVVTSFARGEASPPQDPIKGILLTGMPLKNLQRSRIPPFPLIISCHAAEHCLTVIRIGENVLDHF